jgi:drug/metabolite transporter (DMT)-like permease
MKYFAAQGIHGAALTLIAYGVPALAFIPVLIIRYSVWRRQAHWLVVAALLGGYANFSFTIVMVYGDVVRAMVLFYLLPVWGVLGGRLFLDERIDGLRALAVTLALVGAFLVLGGVNVLQGTVSWIDLVAISCGLAYALNNIVFRASGDTVLVPKVGAMFIGCALMAVVWLGVDMRIWPSQIDAGDVVMVALFGAAWLLTTTFGTQWAVTQIDAGRASVLIVLELVVAVASAILIGGERMSTIEILGGALILTATVFEARRT